MAHNGGLPSRPECMAQKPKKPSPFEVLQAQALSSLPQNDTNDVISEALLEMEDWYTPPASPKSPATLPSGKPPAGNVARDSAHAEGDMSQAQDVTHAMGQVSQVHENHEPTSDRSSYIAHDLASAPSASHVQSVVNQDRTRLTSHVNPVQSQPPNVDQNLDHNAGHNMAHQQASPSERTPLPPASSMNGFRLTGSDTRLIMALWSLRSRPQEKHTVRVTQFELAASAQISLATVKRCLLKLMSMEAIRMEDIQPYRDGGAFYVYGPSFRELLLTAMNPPIRPRVLPPVNPLNWDQSQAHSIAHHIDRQMAQSQAHIPPSVVVGRKEQQQGGGSLPEDFAMPAFWQEKHLPTWVLSRSFGKPPIEGVEQLSEFLEIAEAVVQAADESAKPIANPVGFVRDLLTKGCMPGRPHGFKTARERAAEDQAASAREQLRLAREALEARREAKRLEVEAQLTDAQRRWLTQEAKRRLGPLKDQIDKLKLMRQDILAEYVELGEAVPQS